MVTADFEQSMPAYHHPEEIMPHHFPMEADRIGEGVHIVYNGEMAENSQHEWRIWLGYNGHEG